MNRVKKNCVANSLLPKNKAEQKWNDLDAQTKRNLLFLYNRGSYTGTIRDYFDGTEDLNKFEGYIADIAFNIRQTKSK
jgi:hypothetical protein